MVFLLDTELPHNKNVLIALTTIYGIGRTKSSSICRKAGITSSMKVAELTQEHVEKITDIVKNSGIVINFDLKKYRETNLKNLVSIKSYKGLRRINGLPIRGQRTRSNANTSKKKLK